MQSRFEALCEIPCSRFVRSAFRLPRRILWTLCVMALLSRVPNTHADQIREMAEKAGIRVLAEGSSSGEVQASSVSEFPLASLNPKNRQRAEQVIRHSSQFRRLPALQYTIDEPIYRYLLQHPDVAVSTWRVMGISRFEMWQTGPLEYEAQAVDGSEGIADILYQDANQVIFICEGNYHNVLLPRPLQASALIWFRTQYSPGAEGTHVVSQKTDVFVKFPSASVSTIARMLTPVTNGLMDRNLFELSLYASMMSRAVRHEPDWVVQVAEQMEGVLPQRKGELISVARRDRLPAGERSVSRAEDNANRDLIMSPQLLFFDPPKKGTKIASDPVSGTAVVTKDEASRQGSPVQSVSSGANLTILPASRPGSIRRRVISEQSSASMTDNSHNNNSVRKAVSDPEAIELQPAVPPAGPTATGPAGRGTNR